MRGSARLRTARAAALGGLCTLLMSTAPATTAAPQGPMGGLPQAEDSSSSPAQLRLGRFTGVLTSSGSFRMDVRVRNQSPERIDGLRLLMSVHRRTTSRFAYQQAVDDGVVGGLWAALAHDLGHLAGGERTKVTLQAEAADLGFSSGELAGVYPVKVELLQYGIPLDSLVTSLVIIPDEVQRPIRIALLAALDEPPVSLQPQAAGEDEGLLAAVRERGRLRRIIDAVNTRPDLGVTLATSGLMLEQVTDLAEGSWPDLAVRSGTRPDEGAVAGARAFVDTLRRIVARPATEQLAMAYGPADLVALARHAFPAEGIRHVSEGMRTVERLTRARPLPDVLWAFDGVEQNTVDSILRPSGIDTVVVAEGFLDIPADRELPQSPSPVRRLRTAVGSDFTILVPDPWLTETLAEVSLTDGRSAAAQRLVAETAATYFERPNAEEERGLLIATPLLWVPPRGFLQAFLGQIASAPWLRPAGVSELARTVAPGPEIEELAYPDGDTLELPASYVADLEQAREDLASLSTVLAGTEDPIGAYDDRLLAAASVHFRPLSRRAAGRDLILSVSQAVAGLYGAVSVSDQASVTLTSIEGQIPVTLRNTSDQRLRVNVRLQTNRYDVAEANGKEVVLEPDSSTTVAFNLRALARGGTAPIPVIVSDPEGGLTLATGRIVVHSTAYSLTALLVTAGAGLFLLAWWLRDTLTRRRRAGIADAPRRAA